MVLINEFLYAFETGAEPEGHAPKPSGAMEAGAPEVGATVKAQS